MSVKIFLEEVQFCKNVCVCNLDLIAKCEQQMSKQYTQFTQFSRHPTDDF